MDTLMQVYEKIDLLVNEAQDIGEKMLEQAREDLYVVIYELHDDAASSANFAMLNKVKQIVKDAGHEEIVSSACEDWCVENMGH